MQLAELPVDPPLGAALLAGAESGCAVEVATVAALLSVRSVWVGRGDQKGLDEARGRCCCLPCSISLDPCRHCLIVQHVWHGQ